MSGWRDAMFDYDDRFGEFPNFTTIHLNSGNEQPYIEAVRAAIERGTELTRDELDAVHKKTYGNLYKPKSDGSISFT